MELVELKRARDRVDLPGHRPGRDSRAPPALAIRHIPAGRMFIAANPALRHSRPSRAQARAGCRAQVYCTNAPLSGTLSPGSAFVMVREQRVLCGELHRAARSSSRSRRGRRAGPPATRPIGGDAGQLLGQTRALLVQPSAEARIRPQPKTDVFYRLASPGWNRSRPRSMIACPGSALPVSRRSASRLSATPEPTSSRPPHR